VSALNRLSIPLLALGVVAFATSAVWWWITYGDVIRYNYIGAGEASACLIGDSEICRLARALCRGAHPVAIIAYRTATFWIGAASVSASLLVLGLRTTREGRA
jgi:hypothetical protein